MTRDWLLTLLVTSPFLPATVIAILALTRKPTASGQDRPATKLSAPANTIRKMPAEMARSRRAISPLALRTGRVPRWRAGGEGAFPRQPRPGFRISHG